MALGLQKFGLNFGKVLLNSFFQNSWIQDWLLTFDEQNNSSYKAVEGLGTN